MKTSELLAAKSSFEDNTKWLPFNVHASDTAGIIKRLFNKWIAQNVRRRLCAAIGIESSDSCPHTRGDDPLPHKKPTTENLLSPHAWG